jgi:uncharacterized lipoprotein YajG
MKILIVLLSILLLTGCSAWNQFTDFAFGENTTQTIESCDADGQCIEISVDGDLSMADIALILAKMEKEKEAVKAE